MTSACSCGQQLWAPESIRRGYCEACRLGKNVKPAVRQGDDEVSTLKNGAKNCPGCERLHAITPCFPGCAEVVNR